MLGTAARFVVGLVIAGALIGVGACAGGDEVGTQSTTSGGGGSAGQGGEVAMGGADVDPCDDITCDDNQICMNGMCVDGCVVNTDCDSGLSCCNGGCVDVAIDVGHCGMCDSPCEQPPNVAVSCQMGLCNIGACNPGFYDCDGLPGCESDAMCSCNPGDTQPCYPGDPTTENVGPCVGGTRTCNAAGTAWSLCYGFVIPSAEICGNNIDEDCTGTADDVPDLDGDGWTTCDNDCCETTQECASPAKVNPGAFEFIGNGVDDDCDPATSDTVAPAACSTVADFSGVTPQQIADAMELCQTTTANAPLPTRKWGVVGASFRLASGAVPNSATLSNMQNWQAAIIENYGTGGVLPQSGNTMAALSTGRMRDAADPGWTAPSGSCAGCPFNPCNCAGGVNPGTSFNASFSAPPGAYLSQHSGNYPSSLSCNGACPSGVGAYDSINVRLDIRVPTNALGMSYKFRYFTAEYWSWTCTEYNDFYLALLTSTASGIPPDKNISFDGLSNPVSVNNGFFEVCQTKGCYSCPGGVGALAGTGMDADDVWASTSGLQRTGGGTVWLQTTAPVVPGETITFEMMVFDVEDSILDSQVLLDDFEWSIDASQVGTGPPG